MWRVPRIGGRVVGWLIACCAVAPVVVGWLHVTGCCMPRGVVCAGVAAAAAAAAAVVGDAGCR